MSTVVEAVSPLNDPSRGRRLLKIAGWIAFLIALLVVLHLLGVDVWGWLEEPLGHPHGDLDRIHHPGLPLPGPPDDAHRARLVRDPSLRVSRRHDVHGGPRGLCRRGRAQQLRPREPGHIRHAADVRGDHAGRDVPGRTGRLRRPEDLLLRDRNADLHLSVQPGGWLVRLPVRQRMGRASPTTRC